ncbi:ABC transporter permease [Breznakiella homolactica]|uniref:ABC transporter permease n=1 Tax=Breznakiella homolactica TaxID=2798577 RepID=A0A7T8BCH4_9SPIR|nr:ABC transporter permease [Breznakiella homolactica]
MLKYILKRILLVIPVLIGVTLFIYTILALAPGDPASLILGPDALPEQIIEKRIELGLDDPILVRYVTYMKDALQGDFGRSWFTGRLVFNEFFERIPYTLKLAVLITLVAAVMGVSLGILAAVKHNTPIDYSVLAFAMLFFSIPTFWLGMFLQMIFGTILGWLPVMGAATFKHYILPSFSSGSSHGASTIRITRSSMLDVLTQDYIRTARAKGGSEGWVIRNHVVRNGLLPVVTHIGLMFANVISGSLVIETVFAIPGIGSYVANAARVRDIPVVMGVIFFVGVFVAVVNLLIDFIYAFIDPRVKLE